MCSIVNRYGNITDPQHLEFEKHLGKEVEDYLKSLLDRGVPPGEIRVAAHYLVAYLHTVESKVMLQVQMAANRERLVRLNNTPASEVAEKMAALDDYLAAQTDKLRWRRRD